MAVAAELPTILVASEAYQRLDAIPEVAAARSTIRAEAISLLDGRRRQMTDAATEYAVPLPVDALSTAHKVLEAVRNYGEDSQEYGELYKGHVLDCQRLVAEWYRKKKPEYFSPIRHVFDRESQEFFSHGLSIRQMTENALTPITDNPEEEARRINERVEDATPQILRGLGRIAIGKESIRTISECTDKAIQDYTADMRQGRAHQGYGGYVPEIEKVMIRDIWLDENSDDRFEEQIGLPGMYITHFIIQQALERQGVAVADMDKTQLHGSQMLVRDDLLDFVRLLDETASEQWCTTIFMGEVVPENFIKDYNGFRQEALRRQAGLVDLAETVAGFVMSLAADRTDPRKAPGIVEAFVKKQLLQLAKGDVVVAETMFDKRTARGLQEVAYMESIGQAQQAFDLMTEVEKAAPGGGYCGAGSCGLEDVFLGDDEGRALAKKLGIEPGDTVLRDKERSCPNCKSKGIIYSFNKQKVQKDCLNCEFSKTEKAKTVSGAAAA